jgi:hypothetical protein
MSLSCKIILGNSLAFNKGEIEQATGIFDLSVLWSEGNAKLQTGLSKTTNEIEIAAIKSPTDTMSDIRIVRNFLFG